MKVSREGIVLIKSFEGFRPRAIQRENGGWIIGYGHTLSAREGASVSEADAELLLRYDLLPVESSVNETVPGDLNQHQFDALVSFAFSVGLDRFAGSDVRQRLNAGAPGEAADAIMGWPEPALPETALRRRAAERALFVANPASPVALSDLLSAPLPPPAVPVQIEPEPEPEPEPAPVVETPAEPPAEADVAPLAEIEAAVDPRGAAVAALLGEPAPVIPDFTLAPVFQPPLAAVEDASDVTVDSEPETNPAAVADTAPEAEPEAEPQSDAAPNPEELVAPAAADDEADIDLAATAPVSGLHAIHMNAVRYSPYGAPMVGPLPYLLPVAPPAATDDTSPQTPTAPDFTPALEPVSIEPVETVVVDEVAAEPDHAEPVAVPAPVEAFDTATTAELVLTPLDDAPEPAVIRPLWTTEQRDAPDGSDTNLFGEDLTLTQGGSILRNDIEIEPPARFDWSETGPFIFMGGVGLVSFGASMAAFRRAAEQSGSGDLTIIGWVLALIGLACVGVSSINLYRRFGLPGGD